MRNKNKWKIFCFLSFAWLCSTAYAQGRVEGQIVDDKREPLIGATVNVAGTGIGTVTDMDGKYVLTNVSPNQVIEVSYIGYQSKKITYTGQKTVNFTLLEDSKALEELVVIGYGSVKKDDLTGSVTAIKADLEGRGLAPSAQDLLVGKIAGVSVIANGGSPTDGASIRIRGGSSLSANNEPLVVIDGMPMGGAPGGVGNFLSSINPSDIETFTVLKDASATAIYGSRASNGVIMITTKKGGQGKAKITYDGNVSVSTKRNQVDVLTGDEYRTFIKETFAGASNEAEVLGKLGEGNTSTDWQKEIFRTSVNTEHNVSVLGSLKDIPYRASVGYTDVNGILKTAEMERYTGSFSLQPVLFDKHLAINLNARGMYIKSRFADRSAIGAAAVMDPTKPVHNDDGTFGGYWSWMGSDGALIKIATKNPLAMLEMRDDAATAKQFIGNAQFDYKVHFFPQLHLNLNLAMDYSHSDGHTIIPLNSPMQNMEYEYNNKYTNTRKNPLLELYANYEEKFKKLLDSKLSVMGGYSWQHFWWETPFTTREIGHFDDNGDPKVYEGRQPYEYKLLSFYSRINYSMLNKYLLTFTFRADGSSRFNPDHRWGYYPSAALAWRLKEEDFLKDVEVVSAMKLRLGWGSTGQQDIGDQFLYPAVASYQYSQSAANYWRGNQWVGLIKPLPYNENVTWETTITYNVGVDYGFINNRISGAVDYYLRKTHNLLNLEMPVIPMVTFGETIVGNVGSLENQGVEVSVNAVPVVTKDFQWELGVNVAYNKNKITQLTSGNSKDDQGLPFANSGGDGSRQMKIHKVGYTAGMYYVYEQVYDEAGNPVEGMYVDRNNDGQLNEQDLYLYHHASPDWIVGLNTKLTYKAWDFSIASHGNIGNYNYNAMAANHASLSPGSIYYGGYLINLYRSSFDTNFQNGTIQSDYYIQNASFYRIDNVTLGWSFPRIKSLPLSGRIYASVQNPLLLTSYKGLDPEIPDGMDYNFYPRPISVLFGVNVNF
ncbi:MAG: TonB-dependent receptor [Dysgonamonadaceae bacterium]|jgi:iron complex outermembrane receptor protein|nr:TonB-dependent receptor [Dysgonamonadaceae bacterium]